LYGTAAIFMLLGIAVLALYQAAQREPEFYQQALTMAPAKQAEAGDELEQHLLDLHNDVHAAGTWEAVFTEEQINGWLAADLPDKFPQVLPPGTQEPRVAIDPEFVRVACRFDNGKLRTVISCALDLDLTTEPNTLAVRISKLRAGALPVPLKQFFDKISSQAQRADIPLQWSQIEGDPVALVTIPTRHDDYVHQEIYLDVIELREGEVYLAGHTQRASAETRNVSLRQVSANSTIQR